MSERTRFLIQETAAKTNKRFVELHDMEKKPSEKEFVGELDIHEFIRLKRD
jgi:hypothetical protein